MQLKLFLLFFLFSLFILFSGCVSQEKQFEYKTACLSLTSYSFQGIPECSSQEECFDEVEKLLFAFPQDFSFDSSDKLNSYKNNLASSWLYFNKSLVLVKEINFLCQNNNFSSLPNKTNELAFSLDKAFEFVDKANLDSFSFILIEKNFLEQQEINLIPEESLFDDFILLNQNLNELSTPEVNKDSDSYVSRYFEASREFNEFSSEIGFYSLYLNEFTSTDLIGFYQRDALNLVKSDKFYVPLLKKAFSGVLSFLFDFDDLERSVKILKSMPSNELFFLFGNFASPKNSVASEFSELISDISENKRNLKERNKQISSGIELHSNQISSQLDELALSSLNKFDSNILGFLFEELESSSFSQKKHEVHSIEDFVFESKGKLLLLKKELNELKEKEYFNEISLGRKTNSLKEINSKTISLKEDVDFYSRELFDELIILCDSKIESIEAELNQTDFSDKAWEMNSLASKIVVKISAYNNTSKEEKLFYCKDIILLSKELSFALENQEKFFLESEKSLDKCLLSLEKIFYSKNLSSFVDSFYSLKSLKKSGLPSSYISFSCIELKERITKYLYSNDEEIKEINSLFLNSKNLLSKISFLSKLYPDFFSSAQTISFSDKFNEISAHFSSNLLSFDFFDSSSEKLSSLKELDNELNSFFISSLEEFLSANYSIKAFPLGTATLGKTFLVKQKLFLPNPLDEKINSGLSFAFPLHLGKTAFLDPCIKEIVLQGNNSRILVSCLPENGLFIESDANHLISFTASLLELVEATQSKALFKKTIEFNSPFSLSRLKAVIPLDFDSNFAFALFNSKKIPVLIEEKEAVFYLNELTPEPEIELFFAVSEPVSVEISEKSRKKLDENSFALEFELQVKNNLAFKFDSMNISIPLNFDLIEETHLFDSSSEIPLKESNFSLSLNKLQSKQLFLKMKIKDFTEYSEELRQSIISDLSVLPSSPETRGILQQLDSSNIGELIELRQKTDFLLSQKNNFAEDEFIALKSLIEEKISSLEKTISFLDSIEFFSESKELKSKLAEEKSSLIKSLSLPKDKAIPLLSSINSSLEEFSDKNTESFLLNKRDLLMEKAGEITEKLNLLNDKNLSNLKKQLLDEDNNFFSFFSRNNYFNAGLSLKSIEWKIKDLTDSVSKSILEKKEFIKEKEFFLNEKKVLIQSLFSEIETALAESEFYLPPITQKRVSALRESFGNLDFSFNSDSNSLENLLSAEQELIDFERNLTEIEEELSFSLSKMKEDAKVFILTARLSKADASEAQKLFNQGKYIDSINSSFNSQKNTETGFLSLSPFDLPIQIYPLFAVIFFIAFKKFFYKKKKKRRNKKKITSNSV